MPHDGNTSHTVFDKNAASDTNMISLRYEYFTALEEVASAARPAFEAANHYQRDGHWFTDSDDNFERLQKLEQALTKLDQLNGRVR